MQPGEPLYQRPSPGGGEGKRIFLAVAVSLGAMYILMNYVLPKPAQPPAEPAEPTVTSPDGMTQGPAPLIPGEPGDDDSAADGSSMTAAGVPAAPVERPEPEFQTIRLEREEYSATFSNQGGGPSSWLLNDYTEELELPWLPTWLWDGVKSGFDFEPFSLKCPESERVDLVRGDHAYHVVPTFDVGTLLVGAPRSEVLISDDTQIVYRSYQGDLEITTTYGIPTEGSLMEYRVDVRNTGSARPLQPRFSVVAPVKPAKSRYASNTTPFRNRDGKNKLYQVKSLDKKGLIQDLEPGIRFAGITDRYFMTVLVPDEIPAGFEASPIGWMDDQGMALLNQAPMLADGEMADKVYRATLMMADRTLQTGETATFTFDLYIGPKILSELKTLDNGLESTVQYGVFSILARPMLAALKFMHQLTGSWGIAIILLTFIVKVLVFPLDQASYKSMHKMRAVAPAMQEIRDKFKSDPQRQQQEMMAMYKEKGVNPFSGCLPMLIQMPIWFALYRVLWNSIELYQVPFLYFCDLTVRDPICIFPLVLSVIMYVQQKMAPPPTDPNQKMIMQMMPLMFAVIMFALPSGLVLYITVSSLLRLLQQWFVNRTGDRKAEQAAAK